QTLSARAPCGGLGSFASTGDVALSAAAVSVVAADFNADGHQDWAAALANGTIVVNRMGIKMDTYGPLPSRSRPVLAGADLNRDGVLDILVLGRQVTTLEGQGQPGCPTGTFQSLDSGVSLTQPGKLVLADFDRDGKLDFVASDAGILQGFHGNGDGTFTKLA